MELSTDHLNLNRTCHITLTDADRTLDCISLLVDHVRDIVATHPAPHVLFVSGGVDSQAMLYVWKKAGVQFTAYHVDYLGFNVHDRTEIVQFCEREEIPLSFGQFDVIYFLEHHLPKYAIPYKCAGATCGSCINNCYSCGAKNGGCVCAAQNAC